MASLLARRQPDGHNYHSGVQPIRRATQVGSSQSLNKRQAVLRMVEAVHAGGAIPTMIEAAIPGRFFAVEGSLEGEDLEAVFLAACPNANLRRWSLTVRTMRKSPVLAI